MNKDGFWYEVFHPQFKMSWATIAYLMVIPTVGFFLGGALLIGVWWPGTLICWLIGLPLMMRIGYVAIERS